MKKKWHYIKLNFLYYWSVIDIAVTDLAFCVIHMVTRRKRPVIMSKEMHEELERIIQKDKKEKKNL